MRPPASSPSVTAGLKWPPEMCPTAYAIVTTVRPKASETPTRPMPTAGNVAASTALPQPPNTSQKVPNASAADPFNRVMDVPLLVVSEGGRECAPRAPRQATDVARLQALRLQVRS